MQTKKYDMLCLVEKSQLMHSLRVYIILYKIIEIYVYLGVECETELKIPLSLPNFPKITIYK